MENENIILNKADHIFIQLLTCIMLDKLEDVDHYISDDIYKYCEDKLNKLRKKNYRQMYDELNVRTSSVERIKTIGDNYIIDVKLYARYMNYIIDLDSGRKVKGNDKSRVEVEYNLEFIRKIKVKESGLVRTCQGCGRSLDTSASGKCSYCGSIYNQEDYDLVLNKIRKK